MSSARMRAPMAPHDPDRERERRAGRHAAGPRAPRVRLRRLRAAQGYKLGHYPRLSQIAADMADSGRRCAMGSRRPHQEEEALMVRKRTKGKATKNVAR